MSTRYQIQAFQRQFPQIFSAQLSGHELINHAVTDVAVARVTPELLGRTPVAHTSHGNLVDSGEVERIFLLGETWTVLGEVWQEREDWTPRVTERESGETVGECIARLGCADRVRYVVRTERRYSDQDGHPDSYKVTLFKPPRGWTIPDWIAEQQRRAEGALDAQVRETDAEGTCGSCQGRGFLVRGLGKDTRSAAPTDPLPTLKPR